MNKFSILIIGLLGMTNFLFGQSFTGAQVMQGYGIFGDQLTFIFDESTYNVKPEKVYITGEFRNWDTALDQPQWELKKTGEQWLLTIKNQNFDVVNQNSKFKFRINEGDWIEPPSDAPNRKGGDLVFFPSPEPLELKAELRNENLIWAEIPGERPLLPESYLITDADGNRIPVAGVLPNESRSTLIKPAIPLDKKRVYFLEIPDMGLKAHCSFDGWFRTTYSTKELGANIANGRTTIRIFAPRADSLKVYLYQGPNDRNAYRIENLQQDQEGVWEIIFDEDLHGVYYDFTVHGAQEPSNHFYESNPVHINDPYARVSNDTWGKCRIWQKTKAATPLRKGRPALEDVIAYEVHVQDFTDQLPVADEIKGTFPAMIKSGLKNQKGEKIGFDHIVDLGINTLHLMPVQEYLHFPTEDWQASFANDPYMIDQGISEENYQWGYRTSFAMAVESRYRTKGTEPGTEREEFRDLVQAFHDKDIAVIIDIVPNHTAENMGSKDWFFNFNGIDKQYYYRTKDFEHIGAYGNEVKTENRPMTQRWLIDQCQYYLDEFGIDGFRIDLAGQIDEQTLIALRQKLGPDVIIYGEAWIGSNDPAYEDNPDWDWYKEDSPITFFQDDSRNAYKGPVFELKDKLKDRGWAGGKFSERENVMKGLANKFPDDKTPLSGISYLDIHDNFTLADQFGGDQFDGRKKVDQDNYKIAVTLLYTTLGPIVTHGGSEIMRSKAHAPLKEIVKETKAGHKVYMHGYRDTYNHRTANQFVWKQKGQIPNDYNQNDYDNMYRFWRGMNKFRLSDLGKVFRQMTPVADDYYQFITPEQESLLGYFIDDKVLVLLNAGEQGGRFDDISLPAGNWKLIANTEAVDVVAGVKDKAELMQMKGGKKISVEVTGTSIYIWVKE
ncbi:MAG: alpha-amylase family glycosyl hydrolase [Saprospiraceae bacterium]